MVTYTTTYNLKKPTVADDEDVWGGYLNDSMDLIDDVLDGTTPVTGIDINSGTLDNVTINSSAIGGTTAAAGTFTTLSATTSLGVTGNITVSGTVDGVDIATRDAVLTSTTTTANAALPKAGGTMTGAITFATGQTFDGRDVSADGAKLDGIESGATADQTKADIDALGINAATLDSLDSTQFLRSDAADTTTGELTVGASQNRQLVLDRNVASPSNYFNDLQLEVKATSGTAGIGLHRAGYSHVGIYHDTTNVLKFNMSSGTVTVNHNTGTVWGSGNDGAGSGLDADNLDGYTWDSSGKNLRGTEVYADNWFRNYNSGEGLYNQATGVHWYSEEDGGFTIRDDSTSYSRLRLRTSGNAHRGSVYANSSNEIGFLDSDDNWAYRHTRDARHEFFINNSEYMQLDTSGLYVYEGSIREDYDALSGTSPTCDLSSAAAFSLSMSGNTTFTFSNATSGMSNGFVLQLTGNGGTVTWPSSVDWAGGTAPDAPASGETDIYVFWTRDGGTTWYGVQSIDAAA